MSFVAPIRSAAAYAPITASQTDARRIQGIAQAEFGSRPIDVIIDDASPLYEDSRRTFEIAFPLLRPGGTYVIEDWGWAHWPGYALSPSYAGQSPLSMLVMQLLMLCASRGDLIDEIRVFPAFAIVRKSPQAKPFEKLSLDGLHTQRNIELVGPQHWNWKGIVRMLAVHLEHRARRRLERMKGKLRRALQRKR